MKWFRDLVRGDEERNALSIDEWASYFKFNGNTYGAGYGGGTLTGDKEDIPADFTGYVTGAYRGNGIVFACLNARMRLFSQARFQFHRTLNGTPGELFGSAALAPLEVPWTNATTSDLLKRMIQDVDLAGNFYAHRPGRLIGKSGRGVSGESTIRRLRPDWVTIVLGSQMDPKGDPSEALDAEIIAYIYTPGGPGGKGDPIVLAPESVAHFAPIPDPLAHFRGMSWLTPVIREVMGDGAATSHKLKFFENGATVNMVVTAQPGLNADAFDVWVAKLNQKGIGQANAYKTMYLANGADAKAIGSDPKQADFRAVQGAGETRIAAAAGVPPIIVGLSEGLDAATYSNYGQARRAFADLTMRDLWADACGSLQTLVDVPASDRRGTAGLWYTEKGISFLQEDVKDAAEAQQVDAITAKQLIEAGFEPTSVVAAVNGQDFNLLKHTGLVSVQLQVPGATPPSSDPATPAKPDKPAPPAKPNSAGTNDATGRLESALLDT